MAEKSEILNKMAEMSQEVTVARERLLQGELITLDSIHERIEAQCQLIVDLEPEDAADVKQSLDDLLDNLRTFSEEIQYVQAKVAEILANNETAQGDDDSSNS